MVKAATHRPLPRLQPHRRNLLSIAMARRFPWVPTVRPQRIRLRQRKLRRKTLELLIAMARRFPWVPTVRPQRIRLRRLKIPALTVPPVLSMIKGFKVAKALPVVQLLERLERLASIVQVDNFTIKDPTAVNP